MAIDRQGDTLAVMVDILSNYFPDITERQQAQFAAIGPLYAEWNQKINVISRKDIDNFYEHHVLHSLAIAKAISFTSGTRVLDIGTGGGFPGVPLAIMFPETDFLLVDSVGKKLNVVQAIASELELANIKTLHERVEELPDTFDFAVSRAVTRLDEAWSWVRQKLRTNSNNSLANGLLYLKGGDITAELPMDVTVRRWELSDWYNEPYFAEKSLVLLTPKTHNNRQEEKRWV